MASSMASVPMYFDYATKAYCDARAFRTFDDLDYAKTFEGMTRYVVPNEKVVMQFRENTLEVPDEILKADELFTIDMHKLAKDVTTAKTASAFNESVTVFQKAVDESYKFLSIMGGIVIWLPSTWLNTDK